MNRTHRRLLRLAGLCASLHFAATASAHLPLTNEIIDDALGEIEAAHSAAAAATETGRKAKTTYAIATSATNLVELLNQEVRLHGFGQQDLLDQAVTSAGLLNVEITWSADHQRFFYSGAAYQKYIDLAPDGLDAANARFRLLETGFYRGDSADRGELADRAAIAADFLQRYPDIGNAERVAMFLAIDYRDLWRLCRADEDIVCAEKYEELTREHLAAVSARYDDGRTGEMARALLARFETELANAD